MVCTGFYFLSAVQEISLSGSSDESARRTLVSAHYTAARAGTMFDYRLSDIREVCVASYWQNFTAEKLEFPDVFPGFITFGLKDTELLKQSAACGQK